MYCVVAATESYVADELLTSRAGVRIRIGNTDAEGRMVMADVLCQMKEKVVKFLYKFISTSFLPYSVLLMHHSVTVVHRSQIGRLTMLLSW